MGTAGGFLDAVALPVTGTYTVLVDPLGANIGGITVALEQVPVDVEASIAFGVPLTVTTTVSGQNARVSFTGTAGQRVSLQVSGNCCLSQISIRQPDDSVLVAPATFGLGAGFIDTRTLSQNGAHTILIDPQAAATGSITLTLHDVPADASAAIVPGGPPVTATTSTPGQNSRLSFTGTAGQRVSLRVAPGCCAASFSILEPGGAPVAGPTIFGSGGGFVDTVTLPSNGAYTVVADPQGPVTGSLTLTLYDVPADAAGSAVVGGPAVTVSTTTPGQNAVVSFAGTAGDGLLARIGPFNCCSTRVSVRNPDGSLLAGPVSFNPDGGPLTAHLPTSGTYTLFIDPQGPAEGDLHVRLELDNTAPAPPLLSLSESALDSHVVGATFFYRPSGAGGTFTVSATANDGGTGLDRMAFPGLGGGLTPTAIFDDRIVPYSQTYSWSPGSTFDNALNQVTAYDKVGNGSSTNFAVTPDATPPATTDNTAAIGSGWRNSDAVVSLSPSDGTGSGSNRTHFTSDGSTPTTASPQGTSVILSAEGVYTVKYFSIDNVGNAESPKTAGTQIRIDKTVPNSATLDPLPAVIKNGHILTASGADALSGVGSISYHYCAGAACTPSTLIGSSPTGPGYAVTWSSQPADGTYQLLARVRDVAGNVLDSAKRTVAIDNTPPNTTITSAPAQATNSTSASFTFTATEASSFECSLDGAAFGACTSPWSYTGLAAGSHTFQVRATDTIGNTDPTPANHAWTVDLTPPDTTITAAPANPSNLTGPSFSFTLDGSGIDLPVQPGWRRLRCLHQPEELHGPGGREPHLPGAGHRPGWEHRRQPSEPHMDDRPRRTGHDHHLRAARGKQLDVGELQLHVDGTRLHVPVQPRRSRFRCLYEPEELLQPRGRQPHVPGACDRPSREHGRHPGEPYVDDRPHRTGHHDHVRAGESHERDGSEFQLHVDGGGLQLRVQPRRRRLHGMHEPEELHGLDPRQPYVPGPRHGSGRKHRRDACKPDVDDRPGGAGHHHHLSAREPIERHWSELQLHLQRGRLDLPVQPGRRRLRRLHEPQELRGLDRRQPHLPGACDRPGREHGRDSGEPHLDGRPHRAGHDDHGRACRPDELDRRQASVSVRLRRAPPSSAGSTAALSSPARAPRPTRA